MLNHPDMPTIHKCLQDSIVSVGKKRPVSNYHLWKVHSRDTLRDMESFATEREKSRDRGCWIWCSTSDANELGLELFLVDVREAFVVLPGKEPAGECVAYHILGREAVEPLRKLWEGLRHGADVLEIKSSTGVNSENLRRLHESVRPLQEQRPLDPVKEFLESGFWEDLTQTVRGLATSAAESTVDEIRAIGSAGFERYNDYDTVMGEILSSGKVKHRRVQVIATSDELTRLKQFIGQDPPRTLAVFISLINKDKQPVQPWSFWLIKPSSENGVLYLSHPISDGAWSQCRFLVIREPLLVKAFSSYFDEWWTNKPSHTTNVYGMACGSRGVTPSWTDWYRWLDTQVTKP